MNNRRTEKGQGLVEFAVIFPIFAVLLFVVIDGGLALGRYNNMQNSSKEGARLGAVGANHNEIVDRVREQAHGLLDDASLDCADMDDDTVDDVICVEWIEGPDNEIPGRVGASVRVKVKFKHGYITPLPNVISDGLSMTVCAVQRQEQSFSPPAASVGQGLSC